MLSTFNNLSLGKKLYGLAGLLLAFLVVIAIAAIVNLGNVHDKADTLYAKDTVTIANVGDLTDTLTDEQRLVERGIAESDEPDAQPEIDAKLAAADAKFSSRCPTTRPVTSPPRTARASRASRGASRSTTRCATRSARPRRAAPRRRPTS
jgi:hypothetical protein